MSTLTPTLCFLFFFYSFFFVCLSIYRSVNNSWLWFEKVSALPLSACLSVCFSVGLSVNVSVCLSVYICLSIYPSVYLYICLCFYSSVALSVCLVCLSVWLSVFLSIFLSVVCLRLSIYLFICITHTHRQKLVHPCGKLTTCSSVWMIWFSTFSEQLRTCIVSFRAILK